jgi:hypothetical protein
VRKGSYFYVIDAFVASILIISALIIIFSQYFSQPASTQAYYTAEDLLATMEATPVRGYDNPTVRNWISNGTITDQQRSLLEQVAYFHVTGSTANGNTLAQIVAAAAPQQIGIEILVNGQQYYSRESMPKDQAASVLSAKRIVLLRQGATELYPPVIVEVRTWQ